MKNQGIFYYVHACAHVERKSKTFFYYYIHFFTGINARAPPEPYYGRLIGSFTEFAHGIKVKAFRLLNLLEKLLKNLK